jgi:hypothetical protein
MADSEILKVAKAEDYLKERKTKSDLKDLLKTMVAVRVSLPTITAPSLGQL